MHYRLCLIALVAASAIAARCAVADQAPERRTISVTGYGEVSVPPDVAIVSFAVETTAVEAGAAVDANATTSAALAKAIKENLDAKDKVTTTRYSLEPKYEQRQRGSTAASKISGYVARNEVRVETHQIDTVGQLIDIATQAGANRVSGLQFTLDNRSPQLRDALQAAGQEAQQQAESVATALGVRLKQLVAATTSGMPIVPTFRYQGVGLAAADADARAPTPLEAGEVTVSATLQVTYEIE